MVRTWYDDRQLAVVSFGSAILAVVVGVSIYLLATEGTIGIILLAANLLLAMQLASMPLAFTLNTLGTVLLDAGLPTAAALYLLFALRFPHDFLTTRAGQARIGAWLALGAFVGTGTAVAEVRGWLFTPLGSALHAGRSLAFLASCAACVAVLGWYWWHSRRDPSDTAHGLRRTLSLMLLGLVSSFGILAFLGVLPRLTHPWASKGFLTPEVAASATLGIPLGFAAALLSRQNFGFPLVLRRNAITLLTLLFMVGLGTVLLITWRALTRGAALSVAALVGLGLLLVAAPPLVAGYQLLRRRLIGRLFRDDFDLPVALRVLGETVVALGSARAIADHLLPRLGETLDLGWARLEVHPAGDGPIETYDWGVIPATATPARAVSLISQGEVIGRLSLGPKRRDLPLRREDTALADTLAPLLASGLRNARLIAALRAEQQALARRERALVALGQRATGAAEAERLRLARDLHDVALADLGALRRQLDGVSGDLPEAAMWAARLAAIGEDVRGIIADMRPPELELGGLAAALRGLVPTAAARLELELRLDLGNLDAMRWDAELELALYRTTQEALTNAVKHGRATVVTVTLRQYGPELTLTVADDGCGPANGVAPAPGEGGLGLLGMRERLAPWKGTVALTARERGGATLIITAESTPNASVAQALQGIAAGTG